MADANWLALFGALPNRLADTAARGVTTPFRLRQPTRRKIGPPGPSLPSSVHSCVQLQPYERCVRYDQELG